MKKRFLVDKEIDGKLKSIVVEAEDIYGAMHADSFTQHFTEKGKEELSKHSVAIIGVYEVGFTNHLEGADKINKVHSFYQKKLSELGYDPMTFEKNDENGACINCGERGTLELEEGKYICDTCAQIQGELAEM